jgi:ribulose kinase
MHLPKLLWLERSSPARWAEATQGCDLADFLTWRASGSGARSICTIACKWDCGPDGARPNVLMARLGLEDLTARRAAAPLHAGGLTPEAATHPGLAPGAAVAAGMIDAHAGTLGELGDGALGRAAALIADVSSCIMPLRTAPASAAVLRLGGGQARRPPAHAALCQSGGARG